MRSGASASARVTSRFQPAGWRRKFGNWLKNRCRFGWPFLCTERLTKCATGSCRSIAVTTLRHYFRLATTTILDKKQRLTFEYILISDVNDSDEQARLLARHARRLSAKVNLIPYNSVSGLPWTRPSEKRQEKFLSILRSRRHSGDVASRERA